MGMASGCSEQEAGVASGSGWNLGVLLLGVVVRSRGVNLQIADAKKVPPRTTLALFYRIITIYYISLNS